MMFTAALREKVRKQIEICPICGQIGQVNLRTIAKQIGIGHTSLWRFLKGKSPSAEMIDAVVVWLEKAAKKEATT